MKMSGASVEKKEREQANEGEAGVKKEEGKLIAVVRVRERGECAERFLKPLNYSEKKKKIIASW